MPGSGTFRVSASEQAPPWVDRCPLTPWSQGTDSKGKLQAGEWSEPTSHFPAQEEGCLPALQLPGSGPRLLAGPAATCMRGACICGRSLAGCLQPGRLLRQAVCSLCSAAQAMSCCSSEYAQVVVTLNMQLMSSERGDIDDLRGVGLS